MSFVLTDDATISEGMSVFVGATVFCDGVLLGSMIFSYLCLTLNFSFVEIKCLFLIS